MLDTAVTERQPASPTVRAAAEGSGFFDFSASEAIVVGVVVAVVQFGAAFIYGVPSNETDFAIFLRTTQRFLDGTRMYLSAQVDFTPPLFHVLLIPLARLPFTAAFVLWTLLNVAVAVVVVGQIQRAVGGASIHRGTIAAWVLNAAGVHMTLRLGQVSWLVAYLMVQAWLAARSSRWRVAGLWAGVAIAFKPFLLVMLPVFAVRKQWSMLVVSAVTVAACCALSVLVCGKLAFADWLANLALTPDPTYATHFLNASWLAFVSRMHAPSIVATVLSAGTILVMLWRVRATGEDEAWLLLSLAAILAAPIGWIYYAPLLLGPLVALAAARRFVLPRWIALTFVFPALSATQLQGFSPIVAATMGSIYFWGFLGAFVALCAASRRSDTTIRPRICVARPPLP